MKVASVLIALLLALAVSSAGDTTRGGVKDENLDSLSGSFRAATKKLTTPEFERRKSVLRLYQRRGYVQVLSDVVADDGLSALLSLLKVDAQIAYHLPHDQLVFHIPPAEPPRPVPSSPWQFLAPPSEPLIIPLVQEWTFPEDPWSAP
jgi:hypothetical protein